MADSVPDGLAGAENLEALTDQVLTRPDAVALPAQAGTPAHLSNITLYTTRDPIDASERIRAAVTAGLHTGAGVVPDDVTVSPAVQAISEHIVSDVGIS